MSFKKVSRKEFLQKCLSVTVISAAAYRGLFPANAIASEKSSLVAVRGGEPDKLFDAGIKAMGGMQRFVKKGQTVVVKPNIGWDKGAETGANTNPLLVKRVVEHCINAGAKKVYVFDNSCNHWKNSYKNSGIEQAAKDGGAEVPQVQAGSYYTKVAIKSGKILKVTSVHELILESDVFINIPILKHHGGAKMTSAMKNLMGIVWDRPAYHQKGLHQCIADFCTYRVPDLNIVDAYTIMKRGGPRGYSLNDLVVKKMQLLSTDIVAIDAAAAAILEFDQKNIEYIGMAHALSIGENNLKKISTRKIVI